jgi:gluconolactonase
MATAVASPAARVPGPPELLPGRPDAIVDLQSEEGVGLVGGQWRYSDARVEEVDFVELGSPEDPLGPGTVPNRTYDVEPHAEGVGYDDSGWAALAPADTMRRLGNGRVCFNWYRIEVTLPERIGDLAVSGSTVVFEVVIDDYAEVWVNGEMPHALGDTGGPVVGGFNAPNRVVLGTDVRPGQTFTLAVFGMNGPISASPSNYIWVRSATLEFHDGLPVEEVPLGVSGALPDDLRAERVATGFEFTEGPVWSPEGALLFSSPNTNAIYRWSPAGRVDVFRAKSGYGGVDIGRYHQPGSNGLTFDPDGRLVICQHGNRRVLRVNPHGDTTVLADRYEGRRLNSPNDLVFGADGTLYFTDPRFGLPDPAAAELDFAGVFAVPPGGEPVLIDDTLEGPNGIAVSPDGQWLYVGNWDLERKVVVRYPVGSSGPGEVIADLTSAPGEDAIDGIKVDRDGRLYVCGPGGLWVLEPDGAVVGTLSLPEAPHNLAWGDDDGRTLYITAETSIYRLRLDVEGVRP